MPKFNKTVDEITDRFEKWLYVIRNLNKLDRIPDKLREKIFEKLFETAEIAKFSPEQIQSYEDSLKYYRDLKNSFDTARAEGIVEGKIEGKIEGNTEKAIEIAKKCLKKGMSIEEAIELTGLSREEIKKLIAS
jgi:predicted transposase/invertase (TIGR01784 family)